MFCLAARGSFFFLERVGVVILDLHPCNLVGGWQVAGQNLGWLESQLLVSGPISGPRGLEGLIAV